MHNLKSFRTIAVTWVSLLFLTSFLFIGTSMATAETVAVPAGQTVFRNVDLNVEDEVSGRISVIGDGESQGINFTVVGPNEQIVLPTRTVTVTNFKFSAQEKGNYRFIFDNSLSSAGKTVSFNYDVRHYWFGLSQEFVLMLIVVFIGVLALIIYTMASKG